MADTLSDCIVVRLQPLREADLIAVLLSPERGRVDAYARAARKSTKRFGGRLEVFMHGDAELGRSRTKMPALAAFQPRGRLLDAGAGWEQLALASYFVELALAAAQPEHADPALCAWLRSAIAVAGEAGMQDLAVCRLGGEISWLAALGQLPAPIVCVQCHGSSIEGAAWTAATVGPVCKSCAPPLPATVSADLLYRVDALAGGVLHLEVARCLNSPGIADLDAAIAAQVADQLPHPPRSLRGLRAEFSLASRA